TVRLFASVVVVLGVIASVLLVFTENVQYIRVGLVAALWAAAFGALATTKYRRQLLVEDAKVRDLQTVYQLQLEREVSARREYELGVESRVRRDLQVDVEELAGLRGELAAVRRNLEQLLDNERSAHPVRADRMAELPASPAVARRAANGHDLRWGHPPAPQ